MDKSRKVSLKKTPIFLYFIRWRSSVILAVLLLK